MTPPPRRLSALTRLDNLKHSERNHQRPKELASIAATIDAGDLLLADGNYDAADGQYRLALQKIDLYLAPPPLPPSIQAEQLAPQVVRIARTLPDLPRPLLPKKPLPPPPPLPLPPSPMLTGAIGTYTVVQGDSLAIISAKLGVTSRRLARDNVLSGDAILKAGQKLRFDNRRVIPKVLHDGVVINIPDRTLYLFRDGKLASVLAVAVGRQHKDKGKRSWQTPTGSFTILDKVKDPTWYIPKSIRNEMNKEGSDEVLTVPPGDGNPLGRYALKTSLPGILIHSTNAPASVYGFSSHGCIRILPSDMAKLFKEVKRGESGEIIYQPVKIALAEDGHVIMEVHRDSYGLTPDLEKEARAVIDQLGVAQRVDWQKVKRLTHTPAGLAMDVTRPGPLPPLAEAPAKPAVTEELPHPPS